MPTSGTYAFTVSRDDVINAALRTLGAYGAQDTVPVADITNCAQALNILVKTWVMKGMPLWCVETFPTPMIVGQLTYDLALTSTGGYVPKKLTDAFLRNTTNGVNNDVSLTIESRYDYNTLGNKLSPGVPNQLFYSPNISSGVATLYNVPNLAGYVLYTTAQRPIQDFNLAVDNPDMPSEAFQALKWGLADELALEYATPQVNLGQVQQKAKMYIDELMNFEQEQVSVYFTPSQRPQGYQGTT